MSVPIHASDYKAGTTSNAVSCVFESSVVQGKVAAGTTITNAFEVYFFNYSAMKATLPGQNGLLHSSAAVRGSYVTLIMQDTDKTEIFLDKAWKGGDIGTCSIKILRNDGNLATIIYVMSFTNAKIIEIDANFMFDTSGDLGFQPNTHGGEYAHAFTEKADHVAMTQDPYYYKNSSRCMMMKLIYDTMTFQYIGNEDSSTAKGSVGSGFDFTKQAVKSPGG